MDKDRINRIMFVCTCNTGRSPMALAIARREAERRGLDIELDSCGAYADTGSSPGSKAVHACAASGLDISGHRSKSVFDITDSEGTLYAVMSEDEAARLRCVKNVPDERILILGSGIPDPFDGDLNIYYYTFRWISRAVHEMFDSIYGQEE